jgi:ankyrin
MCDLYKNDPDDPYNDNTYYLEYIPIVPLLKSYNIDKIIKYIIEHANNLEFVYSDNNDNYDWQLINCICSFSTPTTIKYTIDMNINLEIADDDGWKPIHLICTRSTPELVKYMIDKGVDLNSIADGRYSPFHLLCENKHTTPEIIKYMIDHDIDLECTTDLDYKPIHLVIHNSTDEIIKYVIDHNVDLECYDYSDRRPIHIANYTITQYLIEKGVELNCKDDEGWYPIHFSCYYGSYKFIKLLLDNGCDVNVITEKYDDETQKYSCIDLLLHNDKLTDIQKKELISQIHELSNKEHYTNKLIDILKN